MSSGNIVPITGSTNSLHSNTSHSPVHAIHTQQQQQQNIKYDIINTKKILFLVSICPSETGVLQVGSTLLCNVITADSSMKLKCILPVKMPSIGMVDREAALQFAQNLVSRMYIEEIVGKEPELRMRE